jgi:hypothetical protein
MATATTNYGLSKPAVNDATDQDLWGGEINTDLDSLDGLIKTCLNFTPTAATGTITVTIPTAGSTTTGSAKLLYDCDLTSAAFAANLPAAATATGLHVAFKKTDVSANALTITPNGSEKIDGAATQTLSAQYAYMVLVCDGTGWAIVSQTPPAVVSATGRLLNVQVFTASGTYTPTVGTNSIITEGIAGGGGGGGTGTSGAGTGGTGGTTSLGSLLSCSGGGGGTPGVTTSNSGIGGAGGAVATATMKLPGSAGSNGQPTYSQSALGGDGGAGLDGAGNGVGGSGSTAGGSAGVNTGGGGGGAGGGGLSTNSAGGGGGGGRGRTFANSITGTYTVTIGAAGTAGVAGTSGAAGGTGGTGQIIVYEYS